MWDWDGLGLIGLGRVMGVGGKDVKSGRVGLGLGLGLSLGLGFGRVNLRLGDCVWCVLLPEPVANATNSSKTTPPVSHG